MSYETTPSQPLFIRTITATDSTNNCNGAVARNYYKRPLMVNAGSQTHPDDFHFVHYINLKDIQLQREQALEKRVKELEESISLHSGLLTQIHVTTAKTLSPQQTQNQPSNQFININTNTSRSNNSPLNIMPTQLTAGPVNAGNGTRQMSPNTSHFNVLNNHINNSPLNIMPTQLTAGPVNAGNGTRQMCSNTSYDNVLNNHSNNSPLNIISTQLSSRPVNAGNGTRQMSQNTSQVNVLHNHSNNSTLNIIPTQLSSRPVNAGNGTRQMSPNTSHDNVLNNHSNNSPLNIIPTQLSTGTVNPLNVTQQHAMIVAESPENATEERLEIQLAEEDGALNLNSSGDSGRLEICLAPRENIQVKSEYKDTMQTQTQTQLCTTLNSSLPSASYVNKRKPATSTNSPNNLGQQVPTKKPHDGTNGVPKKPKKRYQNPNNNMNIGAQSTNVSPPSQAGGSNDGSAMVTFGPNNTRVPAKVFNNINWTSGSAATRKLLSASFDRKVLATHSLTGKPSPAFKGLNKPKKDKLDPYVVADITSLVTKKCNVSQKLVRSSITTKCADENKMFKAQMNKRAPMNETNGQNTN